MERRNAPVTDRIEMDAIEKIAGISIPPSYQQGMLDAKCKVNAEESSGLTPADVVACHQNKFSRYLPDIATLLQIFRKEYVDY